MPISAWLEWVLWLRVKWPPSWGQVLFRLLFTDQDRPMKGIWGPYKGAMVEGLTLLEAGQVSAGSIINMYQETFSLTGEDGFKTMLEEAKDVSIGANGLRALDFFQGEPHPIQGQPCYRSV